MPDIDFQKIELNLIPKKGDEPVIFYASQYESARPFIADLKWGTTEYAPGDDCYAEIDIRKNDNNLVVITDDVTIDNNEVSVVLPVQALTCIGKNLGQVKIYAADDKLIAALNFLLEVQPDPLAGGVDSETAIDNLTTQIEAIAEEVIGENYYDKTEVDNLLADKADVSDLPDMTQYYTKPQTDTLLNGKADASTTYTKTEIDNALALKANSSDLATVATTGDYNDLINKPTIPAAQIQSDYAQADNTQVDYIKNKPDIAGMIAAAIDNILPVVSDSGPIATINVGLARLLKTITVDPLATQVVRCGVNVWDEEWEEGDINPLTGVNQSGSNRIRCKNYIRAYAGMTAYFYCGAGAKLCVYAYKANYDYIGCYISGTWQPSASTSDIGNITLTMPSETAFIKIKCVGSYGGTYNNDISINYPSTDTSYHAYNGNTYAVADIASITTLNGVNNIYADAGNVSVSAYDSIQHYIDNQ